MFNFKGEYFALISIIGLVGLISPTDQFIVDNEGKFDVTWSLNGDKSIVTFTINLDNNPEGFIALGVSQGMSMINSDIAAYEIIGGKKKIQDYYVKQSREKPILDKQQDVTPIKMERKGSVTQIVFSRKLVTGDANKGQDIDIKEGDTFLIWAYGSSQELDYHEAKRGSVKVDIFDPPQESKSTLSTDPASMVDSDVTQEIRRDIIPASEAPAVETTIKKPIVPAEASASERLIQSSITITMSIWSLILNAMFNQ